MIFSSRVVQNTVLVWAANSIPFFLASVKQTDSRTDQTLSTSQAVELNACGLDETVKAAALEIGRAKSDPAWKHEASSDSSR
jgi:hypothetical protein